VKLALQLTTLLRAAFVFGQIMRRLKQPAVVGEMIGGIVVAGIGFANDVIDARIFVAMVVMALITSLLAAPMMSRLLGERSEVRQLAAAVGEE
jgi:Kef-type K+ transport system membrane component KefB